MNDPLEIDGLPKAERIKKLEEFYDNIRNEAGSELIAFMGLDNFVKTNSTILSELELSPDMSMEDIERLLDPENPSEKDIRASNMANFSDRNMDRMIKFAEKLHGFLKDIREMRGHLLEIGCNVEEEIKKKKLNQSGASPEDFVK